jgi:hypothetical protein
MIIRFLLYNIVLTTLIFSITFSLKASSSVTSIYPSNAHVGDTLEISGNGFNKLNMESNVVYFTNIWYAGPSLFKYDSLQAVIVSATDTMLKVIAPLGATKGVIVVSVNGQYATSENDIYFGIIPTLKSFVPDIGYVGDTITITGTGFDERQVWSNYVSFLNANNTWAISATSTSIEVVVPIGAITGPIAVSTGGDLKTTSSVNFTVLPVVNFFSQVVGKVGDHVILYGTGFDPSNSSMYALTFNGIPSVITAISSSFIETSVPTHATTGPVKLTYNNNEIIGSGVLFIVDPTRPKVTGYSPQQGTIGTPVVITGSDFDQGGPPLSVFFGNGVLAKIDSFSQTKIYTTVPKRAQRGPISVTAGGLSESGTSFKVLETIMSSEPIRAIVGDTIVIRGSGFTTLLDDFYTIILFDSIVSPELVTDSTFSFIIPPISSISFQPIIISHYDLTINLVLPTVIISPVITRIDPDTVISGREMSIAIYGKGLKNSSKIKSYYVIFSNEIKRKVLDYNTTHTTIKTSVPKSVNSGLIPVSVQIDNSFTENLYLLVLPDTFPYVPLAPENLSISYATTTSFRCQWSSSYRALGYMLDVSTDNFTTLLPGYNGLVVKDTSRLVSGLSAGTDYRFRLRTYSDTDTSVYSFYKNVVTISPPPIALSPSNVVGSGFICRWRRARGADYYRIEVSDDSFTTISSLDLPDTTVQVILNGGIPTRPIQYRVRAGNASGLSQYSNLITVAIIGVDENNEFPAVSAYPNPTEGNLFVSGIRDIPSEAFVIDGFGKVIRVNLDYVSERLFKVDIYSLPSGHYALILLGLSQPIQLRFIKK